MELDSNSNLKWYRLFLGEPKKTSALVSVSEHAGQNQVISEKFILGMRLVYFKRPNNILR